MREPDKRPSPADAPRGVAGRVARFAGWLLGAFEVARAVVVGVVTAFRRPSRRTGGTGVAPLPR
jgi:hypothetical protein